MTDEELLIWLRVEDTNLTDFAADRIEQLVATNEALTKERDEADDLAKAAFADGASNNIRLAETSYRVKWLEAKLAKAVGALDDIVKDCEADYPPSHGAIKHFAIATLAEIKGESHE